MPDARLRRRHWVITLLAALFAVAAGWFGSSLNAHVSAGEVVPATAEALRANRVLSDEFGAASPNLVLVAHARGSVDAAAPAAAGERLARRLAADRSVTQVASYWSTRSPALRSHDGRSALVLARLRGREDQATQTADRLVPELAGRHGALEVTASGEAAVRAEVARQAAHDQLRGELMALPLTALLLLLVFRSAVAALLPVVIGTLAVLGTRGVLRLVTAWTSVSVYAISISSALGFALAVDYSLFLLSRYREERAAGAGSGQALRTALRTAGRAVAFSAGTVALSLAALFVFPHTILRSVAVGGITVVVLAALGSLVVLPAVLGVLGERVERFDVFARWRRTRVRAGAGAGLPRDGRAQGEVPLGGWGRIALRAMRRPLTVAVAVTTGLVLTAFPFAHVRFGLFDDRVLPASSDVGRAGELLRTGFEINAVVSPTTVVLPRFDIRGRPDALDDYARRIAAQPGVKRVDTATGSYVRGKRIEPVGGRAHLDSRTRMRPGRTAGSAPVAPRPASVPTVRGAHPTQVSPAVSRFVSPRGAWLAVTTRGEHSSLANRDLARALRQLPRPAPVLIGGPGATLADVQDPIAARVPLALSLIAAAMLALVLALTRRPVLALKALVLNTLSLCATFGALVYLFQDGHFVGLLGGFTVTGSTDALLPMLIFCIAFGLSMDYEIFLLARICEEYDRTADGTAAVARGLDRTARLFTWAALTLAVVMAALATSELMLLKIVGVGLALAVLLDATVVRGLLVPAVMSLAGRANWWRPIRVSQGRGTRSPRGRGRPGTHRNE